MRAFHCSWFGFFLAFFIWFAIAPLLSEVKDSIEGLTKDDLWTSNICSVAGTIVMRFALGPLCDKFGARRLMGIVLMSASIPCACISHGELSFHHNPLPSAFAGACASLLFALFGAVAQE
jgi:nitrate/nitrite transporter NarK